MHVQQHTNWVVQNPQYAARQVLQQKALTSTACVAGSATKSLAPTKKTSKLKITDHDGTEVVAPKKPSNTSTSRKLDVVTLWPSAKEAETNEDEQVGQIIL